MQAALRHLTFVLVKPESIAGRRIEPMLAALADRDFQIIGTWPLRLDRHQVRCLWRYQLNVVPIAHIRVLEMLVTAGETFLIGLRHDLTAGQPAAADLLSSIKDGLRDLLGRPALMLNFLHAPDDQADFIRELAVLCDARGQRQIIAALLAASKWPPDHRKAAEQAAAPILTSRYAGSAAHDLDPAAARQRLRASLRAGLRAGQPTTPPPSALAAIELGAVPPDQALEVVEWLEAATSLPSWDRIVTAAQLVDGLRTGRPPLIGPP